MNISRLTLRTLAFGVVVGVLGVLAVQMFAGNTRSVESASAASDRGRKVVRETKTQHAGRFTYVKTTFPLAGGPTTGGVDHAFCPQGSHLTGAFASGSVGSANVSAVLPAAISREDGSDRDKVADNGVVAAFINSTGSAGRATVEAICEGSKKKHRR